MDKQYGKYKYSVSDRIRHHVPKEEYETKIDCTVEPLGMTGANLYGPDLGATQLKLPYTKYDSSPFGSNVLDQKVPMENCAFGYTALQNQNGATANCAFGIETWIQNLE